MRKNAAVLGLLVLTMLAVTGCHRLGLVKSTPKTPVASSAATTAPSQTATAAAAASSTPGAVSQTFTLAVQNGGGRNGRGAAMVARLQSVGLSAGKATNAKLRYPSTLIMYRSGHKAEAATVQKALGLGTIVALPAGVQTTADVLVIVGKDF
jgi:hypothetical protein